MTTGTLTLVRPPQTSVMCTSRSGVAAGPPGATSALIGFVAGGDAATGASRGGAGTPVFISEEVARTPALRCRLRVTTGCLAISRAASSYVTYQSLAGVPVPVAGHRRS